VEQGKHQYRHHHSVAELLERWIAHIEAQGRAPSTLFRYKSAIRANILPGIGTVRIDRVGPAEPSGPPASSAPRQTLILCHYSACSPRPIVPMIITRISGSSGRVGRSCYGRMTG
jgi:hypothetical protein